MLKAIYKFVRKTALVCGIVVAGMAMMGSASAAEIETPVETTAETTAVVETVEAGVYPDTQDHWAKEYIKVISQLGLMIGYEDGNFHPNDMITEAEALVTFWRSTGYFAYGQVAEADPINGVPAGQWYSQAIGGLQATELLNRNVAVNATITRENFTVLAARVLGYTEVDESIAALCDELYSDTASMTTEQKYSAVVTNNENVVVGIGGGKFKMGTLSRGEAATVIYRLMEAVGVIDADDGIITDDEPTIRPDDHDDDDRRDPDPEPTPDPKPAPDTDDDTVIVEDESTGNTNTEIGIVEDGTIYEEIVDVPSEDIVIEVVEDEKANESEDEIPAGSVVTVEEDPSDVITITTTDTVVIDEAPVAPVETVTVVEDGAVYDDVTDVVDTVVTETVEVVETSTVEETNTVETVNENVCSVIVDGAADTVTVNQ